MAEEVHGSGVLAVVVAALILGQRYTRAHYATRLQDQAVWRAVQLVLESLAFLLIGLQLPTDRRNGVRGDTGIYAQERWSLGRLTANLGVTSAT